MPEVERVEVEVPGLPGPPPPQRKPRQQHGSPGSPRQRKSKWSTRRLSGRTWQTWLRSPRVTLAFDKSWGSNLVFEKHPFHCVHLACPMVLSVYDSIHDDARGCASSLYKIHTSERCLCLSLAPRSHVNPSLYSAPNRAIVPIYVFHLLTKTSTIHLQFSILKSWLLCKKRRQSLMTQSRGGTNGCYNPENFCLIVCFLCAYPFPCVSRFFVNHTSPHFVFFAPL